MSTKNTPGGSVPEWQLYETRVDQSNPAKEVGVRTPEGHFYSFENGESLAWIREGNTRKGVIRLVNGTEQDFRKWMLKQDS